MLVRPIDPSNRLTTDDAWSVMVLIRGRKKKSPRSRRGLFISHGSINYATGSIVGVVLRRSLLLRFGLRLFVVFHLFIGLRFSL